MGRNDVQSARKTFEVCGGVFGVRLGGLDVAVVGVRVTVRRRPGGAAVEGRRRRFVLIFWVGGEKL